MSLMIDVGLLFNLENVKKDLEWEEFFFLIIADCILICMPIYFLEGSVISSLKWNVPRGTFTQVCLEALCKYTYLEADQGPV